MKKRERVILRLRTFTRKVGPKGQMTVPKPIFEALGLKSGDGIGFIVHGDEFVATRVISPANHRKSMTPKP